MTVYIIQLRVCDVYQAYNYPDQTLTNTYVVLQWKNIVHREYT